MASRYCGYHSAEWVSYALIMHKSDHLASPSFITLHHHHHMDAPRDMPMPFPEQGVTVVL